jgi:hypothetical protein
MSDSGEHVVGIAKVDGDTTANGLEVVLYRAGELTARALATTEHLYITDVMITNETGGDTYLDLNTGVDNLHVAADIIVAGNLQANGGIIISYVVPRQCPMGKKPRFYAAATNLNVCVIHGYIRRA